MTIKMYDKETIARWESQKDDKDTKSLLDNAESIYLYHDYIYVFPFLSPIDRYIFHYNAKNQDFVAQATALFAKNGVKVVNDQAPTHLRYYKVPNKAQADFLSKLNYFQEKKELELEEKLRKEKEIKQKRLKQDAKDLADMCDACFSMYLHKYYYYAKSEPYMIKAKKLFEQYGGQNMTQEHPNCFGKYILSGDVDWKKHDYTDLWGKIIKIKFDQAAKEVDDKLKNIVNSLDTKKRQDLFELLAARKSITLTTDYMLWLDDRQK